MLLADSYRRRRVLVTGHTGFKGAWLCEWLLALGADVTGCALPPPTSPAGGGEINESILPSASQEVAFGMNSPEDAAAAFIAKANEALQRAG